MLTRVDDSLAPAYHRVAEDLRQKIVSRELPPGAEVPSEPEIIETYGVSRTTARNAIGVLRSQGLIHVRGSGKRSIVSVPLPRVRRDGTERYQFEKNCALLAGLPDDSHYAREAGSSSEKTKVDLIDEQVIEPEQDIAQALGLSTEVPVHRYTYLLSANGVAGRIAHHYYEQALDARVRAASPANAIRPGSAVWPGGTMYQLRLLGIEADRVTDEIIARQPLPVETSALSLAEGVPVLVLRATTYDTTGTPREVKDVIMPGDRTVLSYTVRLARWRDLAAHDDSDVD